VAGALRVLGRREQALQSYASALAIEKRALGPNHPTVGLTENSIAIALLEEGAIARAREHLGRALAILETKQHPDRALVLVNLGIADARQREHRRALERFDAALALSRQSLGNDAERIAGILEHRAQSEEAIGDLGAAQRDRKEALRILDLHVEHSAEAVRLREEIRGQAGRARRARRPKALGSTTYGAQPSWETE
jgi:tetratricopeptide (TPR) repeat protein